MNISSIEQRRRVSAASQTEDLPTPPVISPTYNWNIPDHPADVFATLRTASTNLEPAYATTGAAHSGNALPDGMGGRLLFDAVQPRRNHQRYSNLDGAAVAHSNRYAVPNGVPNRNTNRDANIDANAQSYPSTNSDGDAGRAPIGDQRRCTRRVCRTETNALSTRDDPTTCSPAAH